MRVAFRKLACLGLGFFLAGVAHRPRLAHAQAEPPTLTLQLDSEKIETGEALEVTLMGTTAGTSIALANPQLRLPAGWKVTGPTLSLPSERTIVNGHVTARSRFLATWRTVATSTGTFPIGPAFVDWNDRRLTVPLSRVTVYPVGKNPQGKKRPKTDPDDPFAGLFSRTPSLPNLADLLLRGQTSERSAPPPPDPKLALDAPLDPSAFLRAAVDKTDVVVGEQVTLSIYLYALPRTFQVIDLHEASAVDFVQRPLTSSGDPQAYPVSIAGTLWQAQPLRKVALFPLHAGPLPIGPMSLTLVGSGLHGAGPRGGVVRSSQSVTVNVKEPPTALRPAGYVLGQVGQFSLQATVEPRTLAAGSNVAVTVTVQGTGLPPAALRLPERPGLSWLEPEIRDGAEANDGAVSAARTFTYIARADAPGSINLGTLELPYWNPVAVRYEVARASLGSLTVTGSAPAPLPSAARPTDPFAAVANARSVPRPSMPKLRSWTERTGFWTGLFGVPTAVVVFQGVAWLLAQRRAHRQTRRLSPTALVATALSDAERAAAGADRKVAAAAVERAVILAIQAATGCNIRGLRQRDIPPTLLRAGLDAADITALTELLRTCDVVRFPPPVDAEAVTSQSLVDEARRLIRRWRLSSLGARS